MKKMIFTIGLSTVLLIGSVYASNPGSQSDPLVTKSYVDGQIEIAVNTAISETLEELIEKNDRMDTLEEKIATQEDIISTLLEEIEEMLEDSEGPSVETPTQDAATYELVSISKGNYLVGEQGTEFILRAGIANVVGSVNGGIQNVTEGVDLNDGVEAPKYHLLIVPRTEGRGIFAETDIIVMVRGGYTIQ